MLLKKIVLFTLIIALFTNCELSSDVNNIGRENNEGKLSKINSIIYDNFSEAKSDTGIYLNEILSFNTILNIDRDFGEFSDWIELYNSTKNTRNIGGYYLTNDLKNPTKWQIPTNTIIEPNQFLLFWADGKNMVIGDSLVSYSHPLVLKSRGVINIKNNHLNFKLNKSGSFVAFYDPLGKLIDSCVFPPQIANISYGRSKKGDWSFLANATPKAKNAVETITQLKPLDTPEFSMPAGFYKDSVIVSLSTKNRDEKIHFTTNGAIPTKDSPEYIDQIVLKKSTSLSVRAFKAGSVPSEVSTQTFLINEKFTLPVISISTSPHNLWDDIDGIYTKGTNGISDLIGRIANYNQDWERPASMEYFDSKGNPVISENCGIKISGVLHQACPQKSLTLYFREKYGQGQVNYQFFPDKNAKRFKMLSLRNSGADWYRTLFNDALANSLIAGQMDIDYQGYRPVVVFLNGEYYGIENLREKLNEHYIAANHDVKAGDVNMLKTFNKPIVVKGDSIAYTKLINFVENNDLSIDSLYTIVSSQIDVKNYIDYNITEIFCANHDWPANNGLFWKLNNHSGKWRWIIVDMDYGFGLKGTYYYNTIDYIMVDDGMEWNKPWSTLLFRKLIDNQQFKDYFLNRFSYHLNNTFTTERVIKVIDSLKTKLAPEMPAHIAKWKSHKSIDEWDEKIAIQREFAEKRPAYLRKYLSEIFELSDTCEFMKQTNHLALPDEQMPNLIASSFIADKIKLKDPTYKPFSKDKLIPAQSDDIKFSIGKISQKKSSIKVTGWAVMNDYSSENTVTTALLKANKKTYAIATTKIKRPDVTTHFNTLNYDDSGFELIINKLAVEPGIYHLGFHVVKNGKIAAEKYTQQTIEVKR